jgi:thiamine biosynthesis protein ThiI
VASQTLENMAAIGAATRMPILRPLVTYDKVETIAVAKRIGTYATSIQPFEDCCSLFVPPHPETRADLARVEAVEARFDLEAMVASAVAATESLAL